MPENDSCFGENPFRKLEAAQFPKRQKAFLEKRAKKDNTIPETSRNEASEEEKELFLRTMARLPQLEQTYAPKSGFLLSEQCPWPGKMKKLKRHSREAARQVECHVETMNLEALEKENEENEAFLMAMRNTSPLGGKGRRVAPAHAEIKTAELKEPGMSELMDGKLEFALSFSDEYLEGRVVGLDDMIMNRLRQGQLSPEAHLDLHGLNAFQAFEALRVFMRDCWFKSLRVALVITGRGRNSPEGQGILRQKLQSWLTQEPFKRVVLAFCTAQRYDGGPGSIYVLLRRFRKKGRICWNRLPSDADLY